MILPPKSDNHDALVKRGAALGLTAAQVLDFIAKFGPEVAALLLKLLAYKRTVGAGHPTAASPNILQQLLLDFLVSHEKDIETWVDAGEGAIFDQLVNLVSSQNALLAAILARYKATIVATLDPAVANALDAVIALLRGAPAN